MIWGAALIVAAPVFGIWLFVWGLCRARAR